MIGLDKTDFKILKILQENGRITNIQLSLDIGLSPAPTLERVRKLEQTGFIKSYHAMVNEELLGLAIKSFMQVTINFQKTDAIKNFVKQIMKIDEIVDCHQIAGSSDFLMKVMVKDLKCYEKLITEKISKIQEIALLQTMMVINSVKQLHSVPLNY